MESNAQVVEKSVRTFGCSTQAFDILQNPAAYHFQESHDVPGAWVPYRSVGNVDVILGDPPIPPGTAEKVLREFFETRAREGRQVLGFSASESLMRAATAAGASAAQITAEPELDPVEWSPRGRSGKKLRQYVRRLRAAGYSVFMLPARTPLIPPEFRASADALLKDWKRNLSSRAHILEVDPWLRCAEKRYFAVYDPKDGRHFLGLLIAHPVYGRHGWHLCHIAHAPDAPKGISEMLMMGAIERFAAEGVHYVTLGPCAIPEARRFVGLAGIRRFLVRDLYGLVAKRGRYAKRAEFYRKVLATPWQPRFMLFYPSKALVRPLHALLRVTHVTEGGQVEVDDSAGA